MKEVREFYSKVKKGETVKSADYLTTILALEDRVRKLERELKREREAVDFSFNILRDSYDPQYSNARMFEKLKEATENSRETILKREIEL